MSRFFALFALCLTLAASRLYAQEICNNGIDDDGDNFVDCFDSGCAADPICDGFFIGNDADCQTPPSTFPDFKMRVNWESPNETTNHLNRVSIGDLDGDGIPEVVSINIVTKKLFILNGANGQIKKGPITVNYNIDRENIIGNIDNGNGACGEIFTYGKGGDGIWRIYAYDCNLNELWRSADNSALPGNPFYLSLANFDGDTFTELYYKDEIVDANTGIRLVQSQFYSSLAAPIAVDIVGDSKLDLVAGGRIYTVTLPTTAATRTLHSGSITLNKNIDDKYRIRRQETSTTSVADYNQDGNLDVIITGSLSSSGTNITQNQNQNTTVFFWDVAANSVKTYIDAFNTVVNVYDCAGGVPGAVTSGKFYEFGWRNGTGRINLADIDGDGKLNAVYVSGKYLYALDENWNLKWRIVVNEETSGYTGCTMFDFNGDGNSEIVYRDEKFIYIINGDGTISPATQKCVSRTNREYPIVADVDGDGATEICVTCASDDNLSDADFCNQSTIGNQRYSVVRAFESDLSVSEPWVPSRKVWNQHGYFNVNVNDDLTIPKIQQKHHITFYTGACRPGDPVKPQRPLNSFLNQAPFLDSKGCPIYASPDVAFVDNSLVVNSPTCPDTDFTVSFKITNKGDVPLSGKLPVSLYNGDPTLPGAIKLDTVLLNLNPLGVNDTIAINNLIVAGNGTMFDLYLVLNDAGTSLPSPITLPNTNFLECSYLNNIITSPVNPRPVSLTALKQDNIVCTTGFAGPTPANGSVSAYIPNGAIQNTADYNFYWSDGQVAKPVASADFVGPVYSGRTAGFYTVYAIHKTANCNSDTVTVEVIDNVRTITALAKVDRQNDNCQTPNGQLSVTVDSNGDGIPENPNNFLYGWYIGNSFPSSDSVSITDIASGLSPNGYTVLVIEKSSGCPGNDSEDIIDQTEKPNLNISTVDISCSNANTGTATATVIGGVTSDFNFHWFNGSFAKPVSDFPGSIATGVISNRPAGKYTVAVVNKTSMCSDTTTVEIFKTPALLPVATKTNNQTSCDVAQPNGAAFALVNGDTTGYRFDWYVGQNTIDPPAHAKTNTVSNFAAGIYTVKATDRSTGCSGTDTVNILSQVVIPTLTATGSPMTKCQPLDGSVTAIPSSGAIVDYTFTWYNGDFVKPITDYPGVSGNALSGIKFGHYAVKAFNNKTHCEALADSAIVKNLTPTINITVIPNPAKYPTDCATKDGEISATISSTGNANGFTVDWFAGVKPALGPVKKSTNFTTNPVNDKLSGVETGFYTINVINQDDQCKAFKEYFLPSKSSDSLSISGVDLTQCTPINGSVTANLIINTNNPVLSTKNDYQLQLFKYNTAVPQAIILGTVNPTNTFTFPALDSGRYYVKGTALGGSTVCDVYTEVIELKYIPVQPTLTLNSIASTSCNTAPSDNGQVVALAVGPAALSYDFFTGVNNTNAINIIQSGPSNTLNSQPSGFYTARVTAGNGCFNFKSIFVPADSAIITADITPFPRTLCNTNDGRIVINNVVEITGSGSASNPFNPANYAVAWFDATGINPIPDVINPPANVLENLTFGTYALQINNINTGCKTEMIFGEVNDLRVYPTVDLTDFTKPTRCLNIYDPSTPDPAFDPISGQRYGSLTIASAGATSIRWFNGPTTSGVEVLPSPGTNFTNITVPAALDTITYTVEVINANNCPTAETYKLPIEKIPVRLSASATAVTFCLAPLDGTVYAVVQGIPTLNTKNYNYRWYKNLVKPVEDFITKPGIPKAGLDSANYIVVATDKFDNTCTATETVTILDERIYPNLLASTLAPLTLCDITTKTPDGVAVASIAGDSISNYTFEWFRNSPPPTGKSFAFGSQAGGLADSTYYVVAAHIVTGCPDTTQVSIPKSTVTPPFPDIEILSQMTLCPDPGNPLQNGNGSLAASVNGNTSDYIFNWYMGRAGDVDVSNDPIAFSNEIYDSLNVGFYAVLAIDRKTLCVSPLVDEEIISDPKYPDFGFITESASCKPNDLDPGDGFASIFITNDIQIDSIYWTDAGGNVINTSPLLTSVNAGTYNVTVISAFGCATTKPVVIKTNIQPYNGISRNGDGLNDYFNIACIENYQNNVVKIFNRAGTLVYEEEGYDNLDRYFDGKSNKGISVMGTNLPDGTYFYIIDKRDGSKLLAGYLEIVN